LFAIKKDTESCIVSEQNARTDDIFILPPQSIVSNCYQSAVKRLRSSSTGQYQILDTLRSKLWI